MEAEEERCPSNDGNNLEDSYSIPSTNSLIDEPLEFEEKDLVDLSEAQDETHKKDEASSDSVIDCEDWQDLIKSDYSKSDYSKVIFCDLYCDSGPGNVGCKLEITDSVHEDPCDYVGLFHIGFKNLCECLVFKTLSETKCEEDGKLLRCDFKYEELPQLETGFYQFLYITHDLEVCGASLPFEIKFDNEDFLWLSNAREEGMLQSMKQHIEILTKRLAEETAQTSDLKKKMKEMAEEHSCLIETSKSMLSKKEKTIESLSRENSEILENRNGLMKIMEVMEEGIKQLETDKNKLQTQLRDLETEKSALQMEKKLLKTEIASLQIIQEKNACLEMEITHLRKSPWLNSSQNREEVMDLEIMVKALEQSKELALKEMATLSQSLQNAMKEVRTLGVELENCKKKLVKKERDEKKTKKEIDLLGNELEDCQVKLKEKTTSEKNARERVKLLTSESKEYRNTIQVYRNAMSILPLKNPVEELQKLMQELTDCQESLKKSVDSETEAKETIQALRKELFDWTIKLEQQSQLELKVKNDFKKIIDAIDVKVKGLYVLLTGMTPGSQDLLEFRSKKCILLSECLSIKDKMTMLRKTSVENAEFTKTQSEQKDSNLSREISRLAKEYSILESINGELKTELKSVEAQLQEKEASNQELMQLMSRSTEENCTLKERVEEFSSKCTAFENDILKKDIDFEKLKEECSRKNELIEMLKNEKTEEIQRLMKELNDCQESLKQYQDSEKKEIQNKSREKELQELVIDFDARLSEAAELYKKQYKEIEKLKKKITKAKKKHQLSSPLLSETTESSTSDSPKVAEVTHDTLNIPSAQGMHVLSNESGSTSPAEVLVLSQSISDSDTGEHMSEGSSKTLKEDSKSNPTRLEQNNETGAFFKALLTKSNKLESSSQRSSVLNDENPKSSVMQGTKDRNNKDHLSGNTLTTEEKSDCKIFDPYMCPYCEMTFEKYMPDVIYYIHVRKHLQIPDETKSKTSNPSIPESFLSKWNTLLISSGLLDSECVDEKMYPVPCPVCKKVLHISSMTSKPLDKHLGSEHHVCMCPCCGMLFEKHKDSNHLRKHMEKHYPKNRPKEDCL